MGGGGGGGGGVVRPSEEPNLEMESLTGNSIHSAIQASTSKNEKGRQVKRTKKIQIKMSRHF